MWKFSWQYGGRRPLHFHAEPELNLVLAGNATFRIGETVIHSTSGDLLAFPPGLEHELLETSPDIYLFACGMAPTLSSIVLRGDPKLWAMPLQVRLPNADFKAIVARAEAIVDKSGIEHDAAELWEHAHWLRERESNNTSKTMHVIVRRALALMTEHPEWDCERVAEHARVHACEVSRYFHRDLGMTFVKYRTRMRLLRFVGLIDEGRENLMQTAEEAGFGSYSQCHRVFQSELGCQPRQFFQLGFRERMQLVYAP